MAPHDEQLQNICNSEETLNTARAILRLAQQKTGPGSGFELGPFRTGLPAICAYLASKRLNNIDVTRLVAQTASCLKKSDFDKALDTIKAAIEPQRITRSGRDVYETLIQRYATSLDHRQLNGWMTAVKNALIQTDERYSASYGKGPEVKCAIFFWTVNAATGKSPTTQQELAADHGISAKSLAKIIQTINGCCTTVKARIKNDIKVQRSPMKASVTSTTPTTTPRRSPKKPLRILPTRDSPTKRKAEAPAPPESDEETDAPVPETSSKKRRAQSPALPSETTKLIFPPIASSSRVILDETHHRPSPQAPRPADTEGQMDVDDENVPRISRVMFDETEEQEKEKPVRRRFRPVYLDHRQWYAVDKRVKRIWKQAERYKDSMVELHGPLELRA
ncbi:hypothetical protein H0H87_002663 [Tephrocybe sp. NHM501043]|nr:hypothetical protein H0H87_002663 [Tephrocybe sp. NHM501043]